jgi:hypothetical protein
VDCDVTCDGRAGVEPAVGAGAAAAATSCDDAPCPAGRAAAPSRRGPQSSCERYTVPYSTSRTRQTRSLSKHPDRRVSTARSLLGPHAIANRRSRTNTSGHGRRASTAGRTAHRYDLGCRSRLGPGPNPPGHRQPIVHPMLPRRGLRGSLGLCRPRSGAAAARARVLLPGAASSPASGRSGSSLGCRFRRLPIVGLVEDGDSRRRKGRGARCAMCC